MDTESALLGVAATVAMQLLGKVRDKVTDRIADRVVDAFLPEKSGDATSGSLASAIDAWRVRNTAVVLVKARDRLRARGVEVREVPRSFLLPLLEACGDVDDETMQDLWSALLAEGVVTEEARHPIYRRTLEQLSAEDAALFKAACENADRHGVEFGTRDNAPMWAPDLASDAEARLVKLDLIEPWTQDTLEARQARGEIMPSVRPLGLGVMPTRFGAAFRRVVAPRLR